MGMTLMKLRRRVRARLGVPLTDQFFTDDVIDDHINLAVDAVESEHNWPWAEHYLLVPIELDGKLTFDPPDRRTMRSVFVNQIELVNIAPSDFLRAYSLTDPVMGQPACWSEIGNDIYVRPGPVDDLQKAVVLYYAVAAPLAEDDDTLAMPEQYAGSVIAKAAELLSIREDNPSASERHAAEYAQWINRMRRTLRRSTGPITPRVREGSWI